MDAPVVDARLEAVTDDACRAIHSDNVRMRLITIYAGPGIQYVGEDDAEAALRLQARFTGGVHACPTGAVAWMHGSAGGSANRLVHRWPPIAATGVTRLVFVVGASTSFSPRQWGSADGSVLSAWARH